MFRGSGRRDSSRTTLVFCEARLPPWRRMLDRLNRSEGQHPGSGALPRTPVRILLAVGLEPGIDPAKVIWASESEPAHDRSLIRYFRSRHVWRLDANAPGPDVEPYPTDPCTQSYNP